MKKRIGRLGYSLLLSAALLFAAGGCGRTPDRYELRELGIEAMKNAEYEEALTCFADAMEKKRGEVSEFQFDILKYQAEAELMLGRYENARKTYEKLLMADTNAENREKYEEALSELSGIDVITEALSDMEAGNYAEAYEKLGPIAELSGSAIGRQAWFNRAVCMEYLQQYEEAEEAFFDYLDKFPDDADAQKELAFLRTR